MKRTTADRTVIVFLKERAPLALLCQHCGECAGVCPSQQHGGIRPAELMSRASLGALDVASEDSLWRCARCMACSERCPSSADPAEAIAALRELAVERGNRPQYFIDEAKRFIQTGISFPRTGMTKKMRKELDLPDGETSACALKDVQEIAKRTALGRVKID